MANSIYDFLPSEATDSQTGGVNTAEGQNPSTVNDAQRNWKQLVAKFIDDLGGVNTVGGTATAVTVTAAQGWDGYGSGEGQIDTGAVLALKMGADATGAATLAVNSLTAKKIRKQGDVAVAAGDWVQNGIYLLRYDTAYDASSGAWVLLNPAGAAAADLAAYLKLAGNQTVTGGFELTSYSAGTKSSGTLTPDPANHNYQYYTNGGAHTLAAPGSDCAIDILVTNNGSAGSITFSGFTVASGNTGDPLTTTNGDKFLISIRRMNSVSTYVIKALQ